MTKDKNIQELIGFIHKQIEGAKFYDEVGEYGMSWKPHIKKYKQIKKALQDYQAMLARVGDTEGLAKALGKVMVCTGNDRCIPVSYYYEPLNEVVDEKEIKRYVEAIQQYVNGGKKS